MAIPQNILLLTNYRADKQLSMLRFGELLKNNNQNSENHNFIEIFPKSIIGKFFYRNKIHKFAAYVDKYLLFPLKISKFIKERSDKINLIHIIDHSNSIYFNTIKQVTHARRLITCHDLIAIRSSLEEFSEAPKISLSGKSLQYAIKRSLNHADYFVCDSSKTQEDLNRLIPHSKKNSEVIHLGTNFFSNKSLYPLNLPLNIKKTSYVMHVGSAAWYKNRKAVFKSFKFLCESSSVKELKLILVGPKPQAHELDNELKMWINSIDNSIFYFDKIPDITLFHLYIHAKALIFPSHIEGFGWPPIEAAVHGCPVITTKTGAIYDLLGKSPFYIMANDQESINCTILNVLNNGNKISSDIFPPDFNQCLKNYLSLYSKILKK